MRIAFFSKQLPSDAPNGVSVQVDRLASALVDLGHQVTCFSFSPLPPSAPYDHVRLAWGASSRLLKKFIPALRFRIADKKEFDIVHYHGDDYLCPGSAKRVRTFYGSALFEAVHAGRTGRFFYQAFFYGLEWVSCLRRGKRAAISRATRRALPLVSHVIHCGVPLDRYSPGTKSTAPSILFIGNFKSRKKGDLLLKVFITEVLPRHPECRLTIVGPDEIAAQSVVCRQRISEEELIEEYRRAWIYCMPSSYEGFGVPAIEAMACGTAVVATRSTGTLEIITDGQNGVLCEPGNLGASINRVITDTAFRNALVAAGVDEVQKYDMKRIAREYESLYNETIGKQPRFL